MEYEYDMQMGYYPNGRIQHKKLTRPNIGCRNGVWRSYYSLTNATLYASPYLVATAKGYTKHYYAESERIASRIGNGGLSFVDVPIVDSADYTSKLQANSAYFDTVAQNRLNTPIYTTAHLLDTLYYWKTPHGNIEPDCYWYHPDHLGSASWVTDKDGEVVQYLYYLPWGEDYKDQRRNGYSGARHTFSAKEKDTETGYSYFGSRYYSSDLSIWLSVDPMASKYPSLSPYTYCANNPVKLVDPNGEDIILVNENTGKVTVITLLFGKDVLLCQHGNKFKSKLLSGNGVFRKSMHFPRADRTLLSGMSKSDAKKIFNFMADNTNVEWGYMESKDDEGNSNFMVGSVHSKETESLVYNKAMEAKEGSVIRYDHSHIKSSGNMDWAPSTPSTAADKKYVDTDAWSELLKRNPNISLGIRYGGKTRTFVEKGVITNSYPRINKYLQ